MKMTISGLQKIDRFYCVTLEAPIRLTTTQGPVSGTMCVTWNTNVDPNVKIGDTLEAEVGGEEISA